MKNVLLVFFMISGLLFAQDEWVDITPEGISEFNIYDFQKVGEDTLLFTGQTPYLYISENNGSSWTQKELEYITYGSIEVDKFRNLYIAGFGAVIKSTNFGEDWFRIDDQFSDFEFYRILEYSDTLFLGGFVDIFYSTDFGDSWVGTGYDEPGTALYKDSHYLYTGGMGLSNYGFHRSADNGQNWLFSEFGLMSYAVSENGEIMLSDFDNGLYFSNDYGDNFNNVGYFTGGSTQVVGLECDSHHRFFANVLASQNSPYNGIYTANPPYDDWRQIGFSGANELLMYVDSDDLLYAGVKGQGLFYHTGPYTPVELTGFSGTYINGTVELKWETASEINNKGFEIERKTGDIWSKIGNISGSGSTTEKQQYRFSDLQPSTGRNYYRLRQIDFDGTTSFSEVIEVNVIPLDFVVKQNYPNPFNPSTKIAFSLPVESNVTVTIYNSLGQMVQEVVNSNFAAGQNFIEIKAENLGSGVYFYELNATGENGVNYRDSKKMLILK